MYYSRLIYFRAVLKLNQGDSPVTTSDLLLTRGRLKRSPTAVCHKQTTPWLHSLTWRQLTGLSHPRWIFTKTAACKTCCLIIFTIPYILHCSLLWAIVIPLTNSILTPAERSQSIALSFHVDVGVLHYILNTTPDFRPLIWRRCLSPHLRAMVHHYACHFALP